MGMIPQSKIGKIQFFQSKVAPWTTNAVAIGTTAAEVTAMETKVDAAQDALNAQIAAYAAAQTATQTLDNAIDELMNAGGDIIKQIRTKAAISGNSVYDLAQIPAPATPSPKPPPGTPYQLKVVLNPNGTLKLVWKCDNPAGTTGTMYMLYRKVEQPGSQFIFIGGAGEKTFDDITVPSGVAKIVYQIQATRTTAIGVAAEFTVNFGVNGSGQMTASVTESTPVQLAA